jgi:hypothetical protein
MKKLIIAIALLLTTGITAFSLSRKENSDDTKLKTESANLSPKPMHDMPKSDLGSAD